MNTTDATVTIASPGRINLIGEHTDYNEGFVLPAAIDKKIFFYFRKNNTLSKCTIQSVDYEDVLEVDLDAVKPRGTSWENYVLGVIYGIQKTAKGMQGFDCIIKSHLPIGAGISSSAALECGIAEGLNTLFNLGISKEKLILIARDAEHHFVGTKCGIMDQYAVMKAKKEQLMLLDCRSLMYEYVPYQTTPYKTVLLNTNVSHNLASSEYNKRRQECLQGVAHLQKKHPKIISLRDVSLAVLEEEKPAMNTTVFNRCKYVVEENVRVKEAVQRLQEGDINAMGALMFLSHEGLQHLYEVSCKELDFLVNAARDEKGVIGARMMGGGFGGCTINLVEEGKINSFLQEVKASYQKEFGIELTALTVDTSDGVRVVANK